MIFQHGLNAGMPQILACSPFFAEIVGLLLRTGFDAELDLSSPAELPAEAQQSLALMQAVIEPGDPLAFAPLLVAPPAGGRRSLLLHDLAIEFARSLRADGIPTVRLPDH